MRHLLLLRHAKAVLGDPGMEDFDRPLAERGEKASAAMGRYMAAHGLNPDRVLCSPARRTRSTWEIARKELPSGETRFLEELYDFGDGQSLLAAIRKQGGDAKRLLVVGHNPATQNLALALAGSGDKSLRRQVLEKYPTGALAVLSFSARGWPDIAEGGGRLEAFVRPRDIMGSEPGG
jgi:phosphohistidine phosphatase